MIEFQVEKVFNLQKESKNAKKRAWDKGISIEKQNSLIFQELCNVVLELLAIEKAREEEKEKKEKGFFGK